MKLRNHSPHPFCDTVTSSDIFLIIVTLLFKDATKPNEVGNYAEEMEKVRKMELWKTSILAL